MVLGYRTLFGVPFSPFEMESWVMQAKTEGDEAVVSFEDGHAGWTTGLWRSLEGPTFVAEADGTLRTWRGDRKERWEDVKLAAQNSIAPGNWLWLWAVFVGIKFIHECGHAFACRRFGGSGGPRTTPGWSPRRFGCRARPPTCSTRSP